MKEVSHLPRMEPAKQQRRRNPAELESWVRVNTEVQEKIIVRQYEEELLIPGQYLALFDFKRSVFVLQILTDVEGPCYLSTFDRAVIPSPAELRRLMNTDEIQSIGDVPAATMYLTTTSAQISTDVLSPTAQSMCEVVFWALPTEGWRKN